MASTNDIISRLKSFLKKLSDLKISSSKENTILYILKNTNYATNIRTSADIRIIEGYLKSSNSYPIRDNSEIDRCLVYLTRVYKFITDVKNQKLFQNIIKDSKDYSNLDKFISSEFETNYAKIVEDFKVLKQGRTFSTKNHKKIDYEANDDDFDENSIGIQGNIEMPKIGNAVLQKKVGKSFEQTGGEAISSPEAISNYKEMVKSEIKGAKKEKSSFKKAQYLSKVMQVFTGGAFGAEEIAYDMSEASNKMFELQKQRESLLNEILEAEKKVASGAAKSMQITKDGVVQLVEEQKDVNEKSEQILTDDEKVLALQKETADMQILGLKGARTLGDTGESAISLGTESKNEAIRLNAETAGMEFEGANGIINKFEQLQQPIEPEDVQEEKDEAIQKHEEMVSALNGVKQAVDNGNVKVVQALTGVKQSVDNEAKQANENAKATIEKIGSSSGGEGGGIGDLSSGLGKFGKFGSMMSAAAPVAVPLALAGAAVGAGLLLRESFKANEEEDAQGIEIQKELAKEDKKRIKLSYLSKNNPEMYNKALELMRVNPDEANKLFTEKSGGDFVKGLNESWEKNVGSKKAKPVVETKTEEPKSNFMKETLAKEGNVQFGDEDVKTETTGTLEPTSSGTTTTTGTGIAEPIYDSEQLEDEFEDEEGLQNQQTNVNVKLDDKKMDDMVNSLKTLIQLNKAVLEKISGKVQFQQVLPVAMTQLTNTQFKV